MVTTTRVELYKKGAVINSNTAWFKTLEGVIKFIDDLERIN